MKKGIYPILLIFILFLGGCTTSSTDFCSNPTAAQCLDDEYCANCEEKGFELETVCGEVLQDHYAASKKELDLVPELAGSEATLRERYDVSYADQPYLYVPISVTPETYYMRNAKFNLLNINDNILANTTLHPLLLDLEFNPTTVPLLGKFGSKAPLITDQLSQPVRANNPKYMFEGMVYNKNLIGLYLDSLYTGKVKAWNDNGAKVESCEEYAYEKFYDISLFKDFMSLHNDDPLRVVEYAYRDSNIIANEIVANKNDLLPGAIGSKFMATFILDGISASLSDVIQRKEGVPRSIFKEMEIYYSNNSSFYEQNSPDISVDVYWDHVFAQNQVRILCADPTNQGCVYFPVINKMAKNFFVEVMGRIDRGNQTRTNGIVLSNADLTSVFDDSGFGYAQECYDNNFVHHFLMLKGAKQQYPNTTTLKRKLLEFKLLRKHLIQLLAARAKWETRLSPYTKKFSESVITSSETLPPSEKEYATMKLYENISKPMLAMKSNKKGKGSKAAIGIDIDIDIINVITLENILKKIDGQIETVLLEAKSKGCLDVYMWDGTDGTPNHNYPINNTSESIDLEYNRAVCDWTPEMFTTSAVTLIPDSYFENIYTDCKRITGGDFDDMGVDHFTFQFPSMCEDNTRFTVWHPNDPVDYTGNTVELHKFESLVKKYPEALLDCDSIIAGQVKKTLADANMNYYDPVTRKVMMSKSRSYYDSVGGEYAGLNFGYALGWLYEGYDDIATIQNNNIDNRNFVCEKTGFFAFGNYFSGGSFLGRDFTICSAGSYASNKTSGASRPVPPTLEKKTNEDRINNDINTVASEKGVNTNYFMFIKNEKMTFSYNNGGFSQTPVKYTHSQPYSGDTLAYQSPAPEAQMISVDVQKSVPICGIISITIRGAVTGDIDAATVVNDTDKQMQYIGNACKTLNFAFTPHMDFDAFAQASITAGIAGVASISAGVETGLKFIGIRFPYSTKLSVSQANGTVNDRPFNYDIYVNAYNNLDQEITLLSGFFGAFVKIEYIFDSDTYRQTLFSWDGIKFNGNVDRVGQNIDGEIVPLAVPVRALYGLSKSVYNH